MTVSSRARISMKAAGSNRFSVGFADEKLYSGLPGIALFLSYLGALTGQDRFSLLADQTTHELLELVDTMDRGESPAIGGFDGLGGVIYGLAHLGVLRARPEWLQVASELAEWGADFVHQDTKLDLISGSSGFIAGVLALSSVGDRTTALAAARRAGV